MNSNELYDKCIEEHAKITPGITDSRIKGRLFSILIQRGFGNISGTTIDKTKLLNSVMTGEILNIKSIKYRYLNQICKWLVPQLTNDFELKEE